MNQVNQLSIFLPFYNEGPIVKQSIGEAFRVVRGLNLGDFEVIAVENGSQDETLEELRKLEPKYNELRVIHLDEAGYGLALQAGFKESRYDWVFFADSDLQIDLNNLPRFIKAADKDNAPMVIGYRTNSADGWYRWFNRQLIKLANRVLFGVRAKDIDCAFKLMHRSVLNKIMPLQSDGAIISTEILAKAYKQQIPIKQLPVKHLPDPGNGSTGASLKVLLKVPGELFSLWRSGSFGL